MPKEKCKENTHIMTPILPRFHFSVSTLPFQRPAKINKFVAAHCCHCRWHFWKPESVLQPLSAEWSQCHDVPSARAEGLPHPKGTSSISAVATVQEPQSPRGRHVWSPHVKMKEPSSTFLSQWKPEKQDNGKILITYLQLQTEGGGSSANTTQ